MHSEIVRNLHVWSRQQVIDHIAAQNWAGIEAILDVSNGEYYYTPDNIHYLAVPINDGEEVSHDKLDTCMKFLLNHHTLNQRRTVIHCAAGISRSTSICIAYLAKTNLYEGNINKIQDRVQMQRPISQPHPAIMRSVKRYLKVWPYSDHAFGNQ